ncbi:cation efflux protein [Halosimplex carlsbadense 2-9-1]|uniref:Cation efflux protein n=1 Tax=Halosimplex carlsbadense 2-9-1 TaxID=797114 RepID=M0CZV3_9EURY|nr:cation diffusion facilitator family transporter [Halosimplex carlsbadense]ELZ28776.1 cation efflux protein [Halosimplex carlsbadense 2-9-1]
MAESKSVVMAALIANGAIAILKFVGFLLTGSAAMLSETYHSISDTGNQVFLLIGLRYGGREADRRHPFGYGKAQFFYAFLVSVFLFGIAGWESAKHGFNALMGHGGGHSTGETVEFLFFSFQPPGFDPILVNYGVLLAAIVFEGWAFKKAYAGMKTQIEENDWSGMREAFRKTSDVTTLTALTEDTIALVGLVLALAGIFLEQQTGNAVYDAVAALLIGIMLMGFALALAWENKRLILGESLPADEEQTLRTIVEGREEVDRIVDFRTVYFGPERIVVSADVEFAPGFQGGDLDAIITEIEEEMKSANASVRTVYLEPEV